MLQNRFLEVVVGVLWIEVRIGQTDVGADVGVGVFFDQFRLGVSACRPVILFDSHGQVGGFVDVELVCRTLHCMFPSLASGKYLTETPASCFRSSFHCFRIW